jgi:hypothetical protein
VRAPSSCSSARLARAFATTRVCSSTHPTGPRTHTRPAGRGSARYSLCATRRWSIRACTTCRSLSCVLHLYIFPFFCARRARLTGRQLSALYMSSVSPTKACWSATGIGIRMAQDVGAHRRRMYQEQSVSGELWRRAFWCVALVQWGGVRLAYTVRRALLVLDVWFSAMLGRSCAISLNRYVVCFTFYSMSMGPKIDAASTPTCRRIATTSIGSNRTPPGRSSSRRESRPASRTLFVWSA